MKNTLITFIIILLLAGTSFADNKDSLRNIFGVKLGMFGGGNLDVTRSDGYEYEYETSSGFSGSIFWDHHLTHRIYFGLSADITEIKPLMEKEILIGISTKVKMEQVPNNDELSIKPGFGIGYAFLSEIKSGYYQIKRSRYLTISGFIEMTAYVGNRTGLLWDVGFLWCPLGGNDEYDVTAGPFLTIDIGIVF